MSHSELFETGATSSQPAKDAQYLRVWLVPWEGVPTPGCQAFQPKVEAAVVGVVDEEWGERPKAYVTAKSAAHIDGKEVIEWMKHNGIGHFMVPREVEVVGGLLPRTSSGKPKKNVLKEWAEGGEKRME